MNFYKMALVVFLMGSVKVNAGDFFERNGVAIDGYDPVSYFQENLPKKGNKKIFAIFRGSRFQFTSEGNRTKFLSNPDGYSPQYNGFCAFGVAGGYKAKIEGVAFSIVNGKLYLNYDLSVRRQWLEDKDGYIRRADENWPSVSLQTDVQQ